MDPRHPSGVGEPQTSRRLPRGVYLPLQPPPRTPDYSRSRAAPRHRHDNPAPSLLENGRPPSSPRKSPTRLRSLTIMETHYVQYSISYPVNWHIGGKLVATGFANDSQCESVEVVDFHPP